MTDMLGLQMAKEVGLGRVGTSLGARLLPWKGSDVYVYRQSDDNSLQDSRPEGPLF